ncbi:hypothetical protein Hanom_Chr09g00865651 [Helianthus anomalus]
MSLSRKWSATSLGGGATVATWHGGDFRWLLVGPVIIVSEFPNDTTTMEQQQEQICMNDHFLSKLSFMSSDE